MLTGRTLRTRTLTDGCGTPHVITVLIPDPTAGNRSALLTTEKGWRGERDRQPPEQRHRAQLAVDTAFLTAASVEWVDPDRYIVAAQDATGELRGLSMFRFAEGRWELDLHTVSPRDQGGATSACPLRGVGSEMLGADMEIMSTRACTSVILEPLDVKAEAFWRRRGFRPVDPLDLRHHHTLSCPGMQALTATYAHSPHDDEDMCCDRRSLRAPISLYARPVTTGGSR